MFGTFQIFNIVFTFLKKPLEFSQIFKAKTSLRKLFKKSFAWFFKTLVEIE